LTSEGGGWRGRGVLDQGGREQGREGGREQALVEREGEWGGSGGW